MRRLAIVVAALAIVVSGAIAVIRHRWVVVIIRGTSMMPTYTDGQRILARRGPGVIAICDVVVFVRPGGVDPEWLVKRVAEVNPDGTFTVLGDNGGDDSRTFGPIKRSDLRAVVKL